MKIAFYDLSGWDFSPISPSQQPMPGTQSALCYLTCQLAENGHQVTLINNISKPGVYQRIECPGADIGQSSDFLNSFDAIIVVNGAIGLPLRNIGVTARLLLWSGHAADQSGILALKDAEECKSWDGFIMVSKWQAESYITAFGLDSKLITVIGNAIAPPFESIKRTRSSLAQNNSNLAPVLAYTSTPFRGLDVLLLAFPTIRTILPDCRLKVYSSMNLYNISPDKDNYSALYDVCRALPGVEYIGPVTQHTLADELAQADILAYPNTFHETSCIAVMEAMAAGCLICSSNLGALPETCANFGFLITPPTDRAIHAKMFAHLIIDTIHRARSTEMQTQLQLNNQVTFARLHYTWRARAREWETKIFI